jgi:hypothetical protein
MVSLDARTAVPEIATLLKDDHPDVRSAAVGTLRQLGATEAAPEIAKLLKDGDRNVRLQAAYALGSLNARGSVPEILQLFKEVDPHTRQFIAGVLCRLGSSEGVDFLLRKADTSRYLQLSPLNALREPEMWKRLNDNRVSDEKEGTNRELIAWIAREAGISVEFPATIPPNESARLEARGKIWNWGGQASLLASLETLAGPGNPDWDFILERDRLRILTQGKAAEFWQAWGAERPTEQR